MFLGRVVLPAVGLVLAVALAWQAVRSLTAGRKPCPVGRRVRRAAVRPDLPGRITAEGRVVAYPGAEVTVGTEVLGTIINMPVRRRRPSTRATCSSSFGPTTCGPRSREAHSSPDRGRGRPPPRAGPRPARPDSCPPSRARRRSRRRRAENSSRRHSPAAMPPRRPSIASRPNRPSTASSRRSTASSSPDHADPGETVSAAAPLVTIVDLSRLRVEAEVDEFDIAASRRRARRRSPPRDIAAVAGAARSKRSPTPSSPARPAPQDPGRPTDTRVLRVKVAFREPNPLKLGQRVEVEIEIEIAGPDGDR